MSLLSLPSPPILRLRKPTGKKRNAARARKWPLVLMLLRRI